MRISDWSSDVCSSDLSGALRPPLERMVIHAFRCQAVVAIAFDLVAERTDHLAVAGVAALAHVNVAPREFERRIGPHSIDFLDRVVDPEQRRDLDDAADRDGDQRKEAEQADIAFELLVTEAPFGRWGSHLRWLLIRRSEEEHTSELPSLMRISYAVFCLKQQKHNTSPTSRQELR